METKEIIASMIKNGAKEVKNVTIQNVTVTPQDEYIRLGGRDDIVSLDG